MDKNNNSLTTDALLSNIAEQLHLNDNAKPAVEHCILIVLPKGPRGAKLGMASVTSFIKGTLKAEKAVRSLLESDADKHPRRAIIVYEDGMNHYESNMMSATAAFLAEAWGITKIDQEYIGIPKSVYIRHAGSIDLDRLDVVADLCLERVIEDAPIKISDFAVDFSAGPDEPDIEYIGDIPDPVMKLLGLSDVQETMLSAYFGVLGVEERFDLPDAFDVLDAMSFGRSHLMPEFLLWEGRNLNPYWPLVADFVLAETYQKLASYKPYADIINEIKDLHLIWQHYQETQHIGIRIGRFTEVKVPTGDEVREAMAKVAQITGIGAAIEAYYAGVPASDIVV